MNEPLTQYEQEIKEIFLKSLKEVNTSLSIKERQALFCAILKSYHGSVFNKYSDTVVRDNIVWDKYDGSVSLRYQKFATIKLIEFKFTYPLGIITA